MYRPFRFRQGPGFAATGLLVSFHRFNKFDLKTCELGRASLGIGLLEAGATYLTLHDIDPDTANLISTFQAFADEHFGGPPAWVGALGRLRGGLSLGGHMGRGSGEGCASR